MEGYERMVNGWANSENGRQRFIQEVLEPRAGPGSASTVSLEGDCEVEYKIDWDPEGQRTACWRWAPGTSWEFGNSITSIIPICTGVTLKHREWEVCDFAKEAIRRWTLFCQDNISFIGPNSCANQLYQANNGRVEGDRPVPFSRAELPGSIRTVLSFEAGGFTHVIAEPGESDEDEGESDEGEDEIEIVYLAPHSGDLAPWHTSSLLNLPTEYVVRLIRGMTLSRNFASQTAELVAKRLIKAEFADNNDREWVREHVTIWKRLAVDETPGHIRRAAIGIRMGNSQHIVLAGNDCRKPHESVGLSDLVLSSRREDGTFDVTEDCTSVVVCVRLMEGDNDVGALGTTVRAAFQSSWRTTKGSTYLFPGRLSRCHHKGVHNFLSKPMIFKPSGTFLENMRQALNLNWLESIIAVTRGGIEWKCDVPVPSFALNFIDSCRTRAHPRGAKRDTCPLWMLTVFNWKYDSATQTLRNPIRYVQLSPNEDGTWSIGPLMPLDMLKEVQHKGSTSTAGMQNELRPETLIC